MRQLVNFILPVSFAFVAVACSDSGAETADPGRYESGEPILDEVVAMNPCGDPSTYDTIKEIVFDEARDRIAGDPVALNDLRRSVSVSMKFPVVTAVLNDLDRTDCSGRLILGIPPVAREAFGGEPELKADLNYSVQPAADGSGSVVTANGFGFLVNQIVVAENQRALRKLASRGGPQLERTYNPSFDCGPGLSNTERMICQSERLSAMDRELSDMFDQAVASLDGQAKSTFLRRQRGLLAERAKCADTDCLMFWYDQRLAEYKPSDFDDALY